MQNELQGAMADTCGRCGEPIAWRTSRKTGRRYAVNGFGSTGRYGQYHVTHCPARKGQSAAAVREAIFGSEPQSEPQQTPHQNGADLAAIIAKHVAGLIPAQPSVLDEARVRDIVREAIAGSGTVSITVSVRGSNQAPVNVGRQHHRFATLLAIVARRRNVWMAGPAGSGKTSAAHAAATALGLPFGAISVGPQTTQSALFGYMDAHGNYVATEFRRRYEQGGVFLFDEIDRGNPGVLTALNQAIENGTCAFPDAMMPRHPDFVAIAAANTYGTGASREYVGALQLDAATLDRFVMLAWDYDESLERDLALATRSNGPTS